jgi:NAD(P)-dependent dehydrogenase (short-subunit alcohol dehydrogenase family)
MTQVKTILITGAAARLGRETALYLAKRGWDVAVHYRHSAKGALQTVDAIKALGRQALAIQGNLQEEGAPTRILQQAVAALGTVTALVNNAATFERDTLATLDSSQFHAHMKINLLAPLMLAKAFAENLGEREGAIINILDGCEGLSLSPNFLSYSLSKYGLENATLLLAKDLAPNIRVNGIAPGLTLPKPGEEEMFARLEAALPISKATQPEEIVAAVAFILETPSLTGQILRLNGGAGLG